MNAAISGSAEGSSEPQVSFVLKMTIFMNLNGASRLVTINYYYYYVQTACPTPVSAVGVLKAKGTRRCLCFAFHRIKQKDRDG